MPKNDTPEIRENDVVTIDGSAQQWTVLAVIKATQDHADKFGESSLGQLVAELQLNDPPMGVATVRRTIDLYRLAVVK